MRPALPALLAYLVASAAPAAPGRHHVPALNGPECLTAATALANVRSNGVLAARLDGEDAVALLDAVNHTGEPTSFAAPTVVVQLRPNVVVVGLFGPCHTTDVVLRPDVFRQVYERMRAGRA